MELLELNRQKLSTRGTASYPPPRIIGNKALCEVLNGELVPSHGLITLVGNWGGGKTHFGYRMHYELARRDLEDDEREIVSSDSSEKCFPFYVPLGMINDAQYEFTFNNVLRAGLLSLSHDKTESLTRNNSFINARNLIDLSIGEYKGLDAFIHEEITTRATISNVQEILKRMAKKFGITTFVFIVDEIEEIEDSDTIAPAQMINFLKSTKQFREPLVSSNEDMSEVNLLFILLVSDAQYARYKRQILSTMGPRTRRNITHQIEYASETGWKDFIEQRNVPNEIAVQTDVLSALWSITGRNFGWFEVMLVQMMNYKSALMGMNENQKVEKLVGLARLQGRNLLKLHDYHSMMANLGEVQTNLVKTLFFSSRLWSVKELASSLNITKNTISTLFEQINESKTKGKIKLVQRFIPVGIKLKIEDGKPRLDNAEFFDYIDKEGGCPVLNTNEAQMALVRSPEKQDGVYYIPESYQDFGARMRLHSRGAVDLIDSDSDLIHRALLTLRINGEDELIGLSWWHLGTIIESLSTELPTAFLKTSREEAIQEYFAGSGEREPKAILRGFLTSLDDSGFIDDYDLELDIKTKRAAQIFELEPIIWVTLPNKGKLKVPVKLLYSTKSLDTLGKLQMLSKPDRLTIALSPAAKEVNLPNTWLHIPCQDLSFLALIGMHEESNEWFDDDIPADVLWSENDFADDATTYSEKKERLAMDLGVEEVVFSHLEGIVKQNACILPLTPRKSEGRRKDQQPASKSIVTLIERILLHAALKRISASFPAKKKLKEDIMKRWGDYSSLIAAHDGQLVSIESPIQSSRQGMPSQPVLVNSSRTIIEYLQRTPLGGDLQKIVAGIVGSKIVTTTEVEGEIAPLAKDVAKDHVRALLAMGILIENRDETIKLVCEDELDFIDDVLGTLGQRINEVENNFESIGESLLESLRISSKLYLNSWEDSLKELRAKIESEEGISEEWKLELYAMLPRVSFLLGGSNLSEEYNNIFSPIEITGDEIDFEEIDISKYTKILQTEFDVNHPISLLSVVLTNLGKEIEEKESRAITLDALVISADTLITRSRERIKDSREKLGDFVEELEQYSFKKPSIIRKDLAKIETSLETAERKLGANDVPGFLMGLQSCNRDLEERLAHWAIIRSLSDCLSFMEE